MGAILIDDLWTAAKREADMENSDFASPAEGFALVNQEAAELHDLMVSRYEDQFTTVTGSITVVSGADTIDLTNTANFPAAAPFYKLRGVDRNDGGEWLEVEPFDFNERNRKVAASFYRVVGQNIHLTPTDNAAGVYRVWYVPGYVDKTTGQSIDFPQNWYAFVIFGVAARLLEKEESESAAKMQRKEMARAHIFAMASNRDATGRASRIMDVRRWRVDDGGWE